MKALAVDPRGEICVVPRLLGAIWGRGEVEDPKKAINDDGDDGDDEDMKMMVVIMVMLDMMRLILVFNDTKLPRHSGC